MRFGKCYETDSVKWAKPRPLFQPPANCCVGDVNRARMIHGEDVNTLGNVGEYPITLAALRREPNNAVEIFKALLDHGACPNVIRADRPHLLALCRARAKRIDDVEPSMENRMYQMTLTIPGVRRREGGQGTAGGTTGTHADGTVKSTAVEEVEREESLELVQHVTTCIQQHKLCRYCKVRKQKTQLADLHLKIPNYTDEMAQRLG
jgi:hypothetical protein